MNKYISTAAFISPCPFCAGRNILLVSEQAHDGGRFSAYLECAGCGDRTKAVKMFKGYSPLLVDSYEYAKHIQPIYNLWELRDGKTIHERSSKAGGHR